MPKIQMRRDTAANWKSVNPVLLSGEWALETDTRKMKIGDGVTPYNTLEYFREDDNEWVKPDDWIDIRSGALPNSVYFLVGHSADYSTYPQFVVYATVSNSGTYDVFVDGIKQATTASGTATTLDWQTLALTSGYDVTYPSALRTHVVRVTPTLDTNTLTRIRASEISTGSGVLWVHFSLSNAINIEEFLSRFSGARSPICEAVTAERDVIKVDSNINGAFWGPLQTIPELDLNNELRNAIQAFKDSKCKKIKLTNGTLYGYNLFERAKVKEIVCNNAYIQIGSSTYTDATNLKHIPPYKFAFKNTTGNVYDMLNINKSFRACTSLEQAFLDVSANVNYKRIELGGNSTTPLPGFKGLVVSNEAPFDSTTSPQLDVSYTGMERSALVTLFNSLPTVSNGQTINVAGCLGTEDLTLADIQIATDKGWNVDGIDTPASNSLPYTLPVEFQQ